MKNIKYCIVDQEGKIYKSGQMLPNISFTKEGKLFSSKVMVRSTLKAMISYNKSDYGGIYLDKLMRDMETWNIIEVFIIKKPTDIDILELIQ